MRTARIILPSIMAIACFAALSAQAKPPVRVVSKELHCSLEIPDGWKRMKDIPKTICVFVGPMENGFAATVNISLAPDDLNGLSARKNDIDEKAFFTGVRKSIGKMGTIYDTKKTTFHGETAYTCVAHTHLPDRADAEVRIICCVCDARIYYITFSEAVARKKKYDLIGDKILASIPI